MIPKHEMPLERIERDIDRLKSLPDINGGSRRDGRYGGWDVDGRTPAGIPPIR